jgi:hypothetical protein
MNPDIDYTSFLFWLPVICTFVSFCMFVSTCKQVCCYHKNMSMQYTRLNKIDGQLNEVVRLCKITCGASSNASKYAKKLTKSPKVD